MTNILHTARMEMSMCWRCTMMEMKMEQCVQKSEDTSYRNVNSFIIFAIRKGLSSVEYN